MLADISSSEASKNTTTLKIIENVGRSSTVLYGFWLFSIWEVQSLFCFVFFYLQDFCHFFKNLMDCSRNKVRIYSGKAFIPESWGNSVHSVWCGYEQFLLFLLQTRLSTWCSWIKLKTFPWHWFVLLIAKSKPCQGLVEAWAAKSHYLD